MGGRVTPEPATRVFGVEAGLAISGYAAGMMRLVHSKRPGTRAFRGSDPLIHKYMKSSASRRLSIQQQEIQLLTWRGRIFLYICLHHRLNRWVSIHSCL